MATVPDCGQEYLLEPRAVSADSGHTYTSIHAATPAKVQLFKLRAAERQLRHAVTSSSLKASSQSYRLHGWARERPGAPYIKRLEHGAVLQ